MNTSLLYFGPQWSGSTSLQRLRAFQEIEGVTAFGVDNLVNLENKASFGSRVRWKLRLPMDVLGENARLLDEVIKNKPEIVLVDNCKVITRETLVRLREVGVRKLVYYSPDDIAAAHNLSFPLKWSLPFWDIVCTTKTFNVPELLAMGVRRPFLIGKAFDRNLHRPLSQAQVGSDFEQFDAVFVGTYEPERCASINALAESGVSVVVYGADKGNWHASRLHAGIDLRPSVFAEDYVRAWHVGKVALCFLRKINRDRITQRTMEIAAIGRPMVAERTDEHSQHFLDGLEYLGFNDDAGLVMAVQKLIHDPAGRIALGQAGRLRCLSSGYSTVDRAEQMIQEFLR